MEQILPEYLLCSTLLFHWHVFDNILLALSADFVFILIALTKIFSLLENDLRFLKKELRKNNRDNRQHYQQIEALFSLTHLLDIKAPLPQMRGWAASPDFLLKIVETMLSEKPKLVLEASSGVSTLISAYCIKRLGEGRVVSLEHDLVFAEKTRQLLKQHDLEEYAKVRHAPLCPVSINGQSWQWYDLNSLEELDRIDMLIVDGPPKKIQKNSRYPVVPLLSEKLANGCIILLDDGSREDETQIVELWNKQFHFNKTEFVKLEKGAWILKKDLPTSTNSST